MPTARHRIVATAIVAALVVLSFGRPVRAQSASAVPPVVDTTGVDEFRRAVTKYLAVQAKLRAEVGDIVPNSTAVQVNAASDMLAATVLHARPKARRGDFFNAAVSRTIKRRIADASRAGNLPAVIAQIDDERSIVNQPRVYLRSPAPPRWQRCLHRSSMFCRGCRTNWSTASSASTWSFVM